MVRLRVHFFDYNHTGLFHLSLGHIPFFVCQFLAFLGARYISALPSHSEKERESAGHREL